MRGESGSHGSLPRYGSQKSPVVIAVVIQHGEEAEITHDLRRHKLADEALILKVTHREMQRFQPVRAGDIREPVFIFFRWRLADAFNVWNIAKPSAYGLMPLYHGLL